MIDTRVGIDISGIDPAFKEHALRGIGRYAREMHAYFSEMRGEEFSVGFFDHNQVLKGSIASNIIDFAPCGRQTLKQQMLYPLKLNGTALKKFDCLHFLAQTDAPSWCQKKYIITVHDIIPLVLSDMYKANNPGWRFRLARFLEIQAIRNACGILAISENTKRDLIRVLGIPEDLIRVTYLGVDYDYFSAPVHFDREELLHRYNVDSNFILYVGGIDPRKNYIGLIETLALVVQAEKQAGRKPPVLLMAGKIDRDKEYPRFKECINRCGVAEYVREAGFVPDEDLRPLYKSAAAFLFLSLYEGFGLTPLEALATGAPVVSSNRSAMPEVLEGAALLVNPEDYKETSEAVLSILRDSENSEKFRTIGPKRAMRFTWQTTGDVTLKAYKDILGG